jgi:hypothetical protein
VVPPPDELWPLIERRTQPPTRRRHGAAWLAAAAGVLVAATAAVVTIERPRQSDAAREIPALVAQSQQLERHVGWTSPPRDGWGASRQTLVYRIADLDGELAPLSIDPARDPARAERLWRQRVALMQSLSELDRSRRALAF